MRKPLIITMGGAAQTHTSNDRQRWLPASAQVLLLVDHLDDHQDHHLNHLNDHQILVFFFIVDTPLCLVEGNFKTAGWLLRRSNIVFALLYRD